MRDRRESPHAVVSSSSGSLPGCSPTRCSSGGAARTLHSRGCSLYLYGRDRERGALAPGRGPAADELAGDIAEGHRPVREEIAAVGGSDAGLFDAQLRELDPAAQEILVAAAVAGPRATVALLGQVHGALGAQGRDDAVARARAWRLLEG